MKTNQGKIKAIVIVKDKYGRVVLDESVFFNDEKLRLIKEAVKNGCNTRNSG